jgi:uncharacterized protein (DUF433 family)
MNQGENSEVVLSGPKGEALVRKTPAVCGGDACIRGTRIMVWLLVDLKQQGASDQEILEVVPLLLRLGHDVLTAQQSPILRRIA